MASSEYSSLQDLNAATCSSTFSIVVLNLTTIGKVGFDCRNHRHPPRAATCEQITFAKPRSAAWIGRDWRLTTKRPHPDRWAHSAVRSQAPPWRRLRL